MVTEIFLGFFNNVATRRRMKLLLQDDRDQSSRKMQIKLKITCPSLNINIHHGFWIQQEVSLWGANVAYMGFLKEIQIEPFGKSQNILGVIFVAVQKLNMSSCSYSNEKCSKYFGSGWPTANETEKKPLFCNFSGAAGVVSTKQYEGKISEKTNIHIESTTSYSEIN